MAASHQQLLTAAAVVVLASLRAVAQPAGDGYGNATFSLCSGVDNTQAAGGPFYLVRQTTASEAVKAATAATADRSSSVVSDGEYYALAQCRADVPAGDCSRCLAACLGVIGGSGDDLCEKAAVRYDDRCLLRFAKGDDFTGFDVDEHTATVFDGGRSGLTVAEEVPTRLLATVAAAAPASRSRTAAGIASYGGGGSLYGLAQCTTQIPAPDCARCLLGALSRLSEDFNSTAAGMQLLRSSCMLRYGSSLFFNQSSPLLPVAHLAIAPAGGGAGPPAAAPPSPGHRPARARTIAISAGQPGFAALAALALALLISWHIRRTKTRSKGKFAERNKLGSGGCGTVYKGILHNNEEIAVKKLTRKDLREVEREVSLVAQLQHENIVKFLGHCFRHDKMFLVYEYLSNGTLSRYFKCSADCQKLDWPKWLNIIRGIARGLSYLHRDSGKDIVHRDLKPSNVLLDSNFNAKIADFDLARPYDRDKSHESTQKRAGTHGYIAPELYAGGEYSTKSDVYSFGVMTLEIIVGQSISKFDNDDCTGLVEYAWQHFVRRTVEDMLDGDHLGLVNDEQVQQASRCVHVALLCVQSNRSVRPSMDRVHGVLGSKEELEEPSTPGFVAAAAAGVSPSAYSVNS
ncbi:hypothetical protein OsI_15700 [Oryza sativa Indica Group]|uniref:Uncharacterized protein n=1 Tax=Oryza sativa subsp. indica TaxID=39946 RepID=B8ATA1_ORYSI|nr:hypothetical protein OsI_15700 [Oryza sativa Indica Group]